MRKLVFTCLVTVHQTIEQVMHQSLDRWYPKSMNRWRYPQRKGISETVLDALGRAPSHLMPEGFESGRGHNVDMSSDGQ